LYEVCLAWDSSQTHKLRCEMHIYSFSYQTNNHPHTVKPVLRGHLCKKEKVAL
jgi:hypothetical protein